QAKAPEKPTGALEKPEPPDLQEGVENVLQTNHPAPEITFEKVVHDFGEVVPRRKHVGEFKFTNIGDGLLTITEVKKCCGVVAKLDKEQVAPGESGILKVEYQSGRQSGTMTRQIYVSSNDQMNPKVALTVKAKIVPKVAYEPQRLKLLLKGEGAGCPSIMLTSLDNQPFSIEAFKSTGDCITADVDPAVEATKFALQPKVDLEKLQTRSRGIINISLTHPQCDRVSIIFSALPRFQITPSHIILRDTESEKPIVRKISVLSNYDEDFEVESASSKKGFIKVLSQEKTSNGYQLDVEIMPPVAADAKRFMDVLSVNIKGGEQLTFTSLGRHSRK
ncbi:MAG: DUF1573 domain-containing protein, partial [Planctomycetota bacterium]